MVRKLNIPSIRANSPCGVKNNEYITAIINVSTAILTDKWKAASPVDPFHVDSSGSSVCDTNNCQFHYP